MIRLHREGKATILIVTLLFLCSLVYLMMVVTVLSVLLSIATLVLLMFVLHFFRNPERPVSDTHPGKIYSPADGKVVVIEEHFEEEFLKEKRIQVSIFMSPLDVHRNTSPIEGKVVFKRYHPGKYLVAWHPKSSTENERMTIVIENTHVTLLMRQIAGAVARRIVNYFETRDEVEQGQEMGFIKFGSRMDIMLPTHAKIHVSPGQHVRANIDVLATVD